MEETTVKKEIVVKRLSAFKFAVEVSVNNETEVMARESVIQKAPPAAKVAPINDAPQITNGPFLIRHAILQRIVEILLWRLLGEQRLRAFCGYPAASACTLLRRVICLSSANPRTPPPSSQVDTKCNGSLACFLEQAAKFLEICAPNEELWSRFGWNRLSEEAILRKIYDDEISPNVRASDLAGDPNMVKVNGELQLLLLWERQGFTAVTWRQEDKILMPMPPPRALWTSRIMNAHHPSPHKLVSRARSSSWESGGRKMGVPSSRGVVGPGKTVGWTPRSRNDVNKTSSAALVGGELPRPSPWARQLRYVRTNPMVHWDVTVATRPRTMQHSFPGPVPIARQY